jgi:hypothetical protein
MQKTMSVMAVALFIAFTLYLLQLLDVLRLSSSPAMRWLNVTVALATWLYFGMELWRKLFSK